MACTKSQEGAAPKSGSIVSTADSYPVFIIKTATIIPPMPSTGKEVNLEETMEMITITFEIISARLSFAVASIATELIFFELE